MVNRERDIAVRAYHIWEFEGYLNGRDLDHWLRAETELAVAAAPKVPAADPPPQAANTRQRRSRKR